MQSGFASVIWICGGGWCFVHFGLISTGFLLGFKPVESWFVSACPTDLVTVGNDDDWGTGPEIVTRRAEVE